MILITGATGTVGSDAPSRLSMCRPSPYGRRWLNWGSQLDRRTDYSKSSRCTVVARLPRSNQACVKPWADLLVHLTSSRVTTPRCSLDDGAQEVRHGVERTCITSRSEGLLVSGAALRSVPLSQPLHSVVRQTRDLDMWDPDAIVEARRTGRGPAAAVQLVRTILAGLRLASAGGVYLRIDAHRCASFPHCLSTGGTRELE
jgi:hypothetical protein